MEPIGILYLSSMLQTNGHQAFLSDSSMDNIIKITKEKNIELFAISCMNTDYKYYLILSQNFKKKFPKIPIIWGGPTPTFNPEIINESSIDIICRGEGEKALLELVNRLENNRKINRISNLWIKEKSIIYRNNVKNLIEDLDQLPFPDRSLTQKFSQFKYSPIKVVVASRGCPFNCSFCFNHKYHQLYLGKGKIIRVRSVENIIKELEELKENFNAKFFYFLDDVFPYDNQWVNDFSREYVRRVNIPFTIVTSVVFINDNFVKCIKKAGCVSIHLAIECGNEKIREKVLNKHISNHQILKACKIIKKYGIAISAYNMVGIPFSKFEDELETLDLNLKAKVDSVYVAFCLPFLETQLGKVAKKANLISIDTEFLSWFEKIPINIEYREKIEKVAYLFTLIIMFPWLRPYLLILLKTPIPKFFLKSSKDIISGYCLKKKIIPVNSSIWEFSITSVYFIMKRFTK